jgi:hypothetical protein
MKTENRAGGVGSIQSQHFRANFDATKIRTILKWFAFKMGRVAEMPRRKIKLSLYVALSLLFWVLALGPGGGGTDAVHVYWEGAAVNLLLLFPLWRGAMWAVVILWFEALLLCGGIGSEGIPPSGPAFGLLAFVAGAQFLILCSLWSSSEDGQRAASVG